MLWFLDSLTSGGYIPDVEETGYLTTKQAAERLGVSVGRVQQLVAEGRLPATKIGRDNFIKDEDLELVADRKPGRPKGFSPKKK